jgi:hypothetical protein
MDDKVTEQNTSHVFAADANIGGSDTEPPKRRFLVRALCCILVPPAFAAYYIWTYVQLLQPLSDGGSIEDAGVRALNGRYIWWSWFIIGAIGLNVSTYVLAGVEAGMLTTPRFGALNSDQVEMHKDKSWSTISGWVRMGRHVFVKQQPGQGPRFSWVWAPLFILSVLSWGFVLSGLTMEVQPSFKAGHVAGAKVVGANATSFDRRSTADVLEAAYQEWGQGGEPQIPSIGALYTFSDDESTPLKDFNMTTGNSLPRDADATVFLAPQAEVPVTGTAWGIALGYSCRTIHRLQDFKILSKRISSTARGYVSGTGANPDAEPDKDIPRFDPPDHFFYKVPDLPGDETIHVLMEPSPGWRGDSAVAEVGIGSGIYNVMDDLTRSYSSEYEGLEEVEILEFALWQLPEIGSPPVAVEGSIPELDGEYSVYQGDQWSPGPAVPLTAIGVQCSSSSATGSARLDGLVGRARDFRREDPIGLGNEREDHIWNLPRFSFAVPAMFLPGIRGSSAFDILEGMDYGRPQYQFQPLSDVMSWLPDDIDYQYVTVEDTFYLASPAWVVPLFTAGSVPFDGNSEGYVGQPYLHPARPEDLQRALQNAYRHVAIKLMYNQQDSLYQAWTQPDMTAAVPWRTLAKPDDGVPALLVLIMLSLWALGCVVLGLVYSFRRRWEDIFSVGSLYWYCQRTVGIDPVEEIKKVN